MPTAVLVDGWHLGGSSALRGIGTYLRGVLPPLATDPDLDVTVLATGTTPLPACVARRTIARRAPSRYAAREHDLLLPFDLARAARAAPVDVVFSPADDPPRRAPRPWVQMLHDVIPLVVPDPAFAADRRRWERIGARLRDAATVITNSQHTAADATRVLGIDPARLRPIALGVDPRFRPPATREPAEPPYLLYVGEYGPHKGFAEAFALAGAVADAGLPHRVVMIGRLAPWYEPIVRDLLARAPRPDRVELRGFVDDLVAVYQQADALVVTSRYEGFCLPALEAMACGTPVVAFDNSALHEVVGPGGVLVPDGDVDAFARVLATLLRDPRPWEETAQRGVEHARPFTWERAAAEHAEVLRAAAAAPG